MKDPRIYLLHIRDAVDRVLRYTAEGRSAFLADSKTQDAVVRNLEIIGEAVKTCLMAKLVFPWMWQPVLASGVEFTTRQYDYERRLIPSHEHP